MAYELNLTIFTEDALILPQYSNPIKEIHDKFFFEEWPIQIVLNMDLCFLGDDRFIFLKMSTSACSAAT